MLEDLFVIPRWTSRRSANKLALFLRRYLRRQKLVSMPMQAKCLISLVGRSGQNWALGPGHSLALQSPPLRAFKPAVMACFLLVRPHHLHRENESALSGQRDQPYAPLHGS